MRLDMAFNEHTSLWFSSLDPVTFMLKISLKPASSGSPLNLLCSPLVSEVMEARSCHKDKKLG